MFGQTRARQVVFQPECSCLREEIDFDLFDPPVIRLVGFEGEYSYHAAHRPRPKLAHLILVQIETAEA